MTSDIVPFIVLYFLISFALAMPLASFLLPDYSGKNPVLVFIGITFGWPILLPIAIFFGVIVAAIELIKGFWR